MSRAFGRWAFVVISLAGMAACKKSEAPSTQPATQPVVAPGSATAPATATAPDGAAPQAAADPWSKPASAKDPLAKPFFWSAAKDGKTSYFLGTMHMGIDAETRLPPIVWDKLDAAPAFAMETDLSDASLASLGTRAHGTLRDDLGPDYWQKLERAIGAQMAAGINGMKPMIAATLLSLQHLPKTAPMDGVLLGRAMNQKKRIVYLEEAKLQAAILEKHMNLKALKLMLDTQDQSATQTQEMLAAYAAGDADALVRITEAQRADALAHGFTGAEYEQQMDDLLYKRNASWIEPIEKLHAAGGGFVAVGTLHLVGKDGHSVLELLQKRGFQIERVTP